MCAAPSISIHSLRMEGDRFPVRWIALLPAISIHSLRMEGDICDHIRRNLRIGISIHSLRMEGDDGIPELIAWAERQTFQGAS